MQISTRRQRQNKRVTTTPRPLSFIIYEPSKYIFTFLVNGPLDIEVEKEKSAERQIKSRNHFLCKWIQATSSIFNIKTINECRNVPHFLCLRNQITFLFCFLLLCVSLNCVNWKFTAMWLFNSRRGSLLLIIGRETISNKAALWHKTPTLSIDRPKTWNFSWKQTTINCF